MSPSNASIHLITPLRSIKELVFDGSRRAIADASEIFDFTGIPISNGSTSNVTS